MYILGFLPYICIQMGETRMNFYVLSLPKCAYECFKTMYQIYILHIFSYTLHFVNLCYLMLFISLLSSEMIVEQKYYKFTKVSQIIFKVNVQSFNILQYVVLIESRTREPLWQFYGYSCLVFVLISVTHPNFHFLDV